MQDDERLREALLELQDLRQREARMLDETRTLFRVLNTLQTVSTKDQAFDTLLTSSMDVLKADLVCVFAHQDGAMRIVASTQPDLCALSDARASAFAPIALSDVPIFGKPRNLADISTLMPWSDLAGLADPDRDPLRSLLSAPLNLGDGQTPGALVALHRQSAHFTNADRRLLSRITALAGQTLTSLELQIRNRLLAATIDGSSSGFAIANARDPNRPLIFVNPAFESLSGYSSAEVIGKNCRFMNAEPKTSSERARLRETVRTNGTGTFVMRNKRRDGSLFWNELSLFPVMGADGTPEFLVATQTDVSPRVTAQRQSETNRQRMLEALSHTDNGFLLLDKDLTILFSNARFHQILPAPGLGWAEGSSTRENLAAHLATIPAPQLARAPDISQLDLHAIAQSTAATEMALPDGRTLLIRAQSTAEDGLVVSTTDITPTKTAEHTLRSRVAAIEHAPDGIAIADPSGRIVHANPSLCTILQARSETALLGRRWSTFYKNDNAQALIRDITKRLAAQGQASDQLAFGGQGSDRRWHDVALRQVDEVGVILIVRDITEQREVRRKRSELDQQLNQARRQQVVSQMAAGLAHDFNNLLSAITGSALLITGDAATDTKVRTHADRITAAGQQAAWLVNRLLDLGRDIQDSAEFDLRQSIKSATDLLSVTLAPGVKLQSDLASQPLLVLGSPTEMTQIALNIMLNAQDALSTEGGTLRVGLHQVTTPTTPPRVGRLDPGRSYGALTVTDDGSGISGEDMEKIFEPYFSTKGAQGTGLGLATVASMVVAAHGAISVTSTPGQGTTVTIYLPLGADPKTPDQDQSETTRADLSGTLILVVDDETEVADVIGSYLERLGAEVAVVSDPELAVESIQEDPEAWSAIVSDYDMGAFSGGDLVAEVTRIAPNLPILIVTALSRRLADPRVSAPAVKGIFSKPPDLRQISRIIAKEARHTERQES